MMPVLQGVGKGDRPWYSYGLQASLAGHLGISWETLVVDPVATTERSLGLAPSDLLSAHAAIFQGS